jgi:hypothetical protein
MLNLGCQRCTFTANGDRRLLSRNIGKRFEQGSIFVEKVTVNMIESLVKQNEKGVREMFRLD